MKKGTETRRSTRSRTRDRVSKVLNQAKNQARESLRLFETLEKSAIERARGFVKIPISTSGNEAILASLRKIGVGSQKDLDALRLRIEKLEALVTTSVERAEKFLLAAERNRTAAAATVARDTAPGDSSALPQ
jgi:hypothetical protein